MPPLTVPDAVRNKAALAGLDGWLDALPGIVAGLEAEWGFTTGAPFLDGSEAFVARVTRSDGTPAVLKVLLPRDDAIALHEITVLQLAGGEGCARMFASNLARGAMLLERLGPSLSTLNLPADERQAILCATARRVWRPAAGWGLPTGAEKGRWLIDYIIETWEALGRPCSEQAIAYAVSCAERRIAAHDDERSVLVHGDIHQWNALQAPGGFKLVDPDGLLAEAEYDLGVIMREDPVQLLQGDPHERSRRLARLTGCDERATWEWGAAERVSTAFVLLGIGFESVGREMLAAAEFCAVEG
ncbi:MAG TPA: aminoglycoside phosphotransferase family protein [Tepidiformaceae bacterium]|nr:aminoglycoside phosphotransferase family protein [Tepidiformaceae bacterium]